MRLHVTLSACVLSLLTAVAPTGCGGGSQPSKDSQGTDDVLPMLDARDTGSDASRDLAGTETGTDSSGRDLHSDGIDDGRNPDTAGSDVPVDTEPPPRCTPGDPCDDRDPCTIDDLCAGDETCSGTPVEACDDAIDCTQDACTTAQDCTHDIKPGWCLVEGICYEEGAVDPQRPCRSCVTALVQDDLLPDDTLACDDGDGCTSGDHCKAGACIGAARNCDDSEPCTMDGCAGGECTHVPLDGPCDDGSLCTENDACAEGVCKGETVGCFDQNPCTQDTCNPLFGCVYEFNSEPCDDGNVCTVGDLCGLGICQSGTGRLDCDDGNLCTDDGCVPTRADGCVHIPNIAPCDDGDPCTVGDACRRGLCQSGIEPLACDDGNPCTDDSCKPGVGCDFVNNTAPCDDGEPCFLDDVCSNGACAPGPTRLVCDDQNACTDDACDVGVGCANRPNADSCDDGNVCTIQDSCTAGVCIGQLLPGVCDDENDCTGDFCRPEGGCGHKALPACRPQIVIDYPPRAATLASYQFVLDPTSGQPILDGNGRPKIGVRGHIEYPQSNSGILVTEVNINGRTCLVNPFDNTFACRADDGSTLDGYPMVVTQGANWIVASGESQPICNTVSCSNSACNIADCDVYNDLCQVCNTFADHVVQSFYYSTQWYDFRGVPPAAPPTVKDGLEMFLGKTVWDDNDTSTPNDIATILTLFVQSMDIGSLIQNPVTSGSFGWCNYRVNLSHFRFGRIAVDLVPIQGGLDFSATIPNFSVDIDIPISGFLCPDFSGNASINLISMSARLGITMGANGEPSVVIQSSDVSLSNLNVDIDGIWGFLFNWIVDFFEDSFRQQIEDQFKAVIANDVGPAIGDAIKGLAIDQTFQIPGFLPGTNPLTLRMVAKPSTLDFTPDGAVIGLKSTIYGQKGVTYNPLGSIGRASCLGATEPPLAMPKTRPLALGLHDDLFNLIPYALYWAGGLRLPLDPSQLGGAAVDLSSYGISEMVLAIDFLIPPILTSCNPGNRLTLQAGDVGIKATMKLFGSPVEMQMYASLEAEARVFVQVGASGGNELALAIKEPTFIDIEIASLAGGLVGAEDSLGKLIKDTALPLVLKALSGNTLASFPIPEIDLHAIASQMPVGSKIAIDIQDLSRINGNTVVSGLVK